MTATFVRGPISFGCSVNEDLYWYGSQNDAFSTWFGRSGLRSMAGRDTQAGAIITGLQKPDKLLPEPYLSYFRHFQSLSTSVPRVLVAGYGFGDQHVNAVLSRIGKWGGPQRRIAFIDYWEPTRWQPASIWPSHRLEFYRVAAKLSQQTDAFDQLDWPDPWISSGPIPGRVEAYFRGMVGTLATHSNRIASFLKGE